MNKYDEMISEAIKHCEKYYDSGVWIIANYLDNMEPRFYSRELIGRFFKVYHCKEIQRNTKNNDKNNRYLPHIGDINPIIYEELQKQSDKNYDEVKRQLTVIKNIVNDPHNTEEEEDEYRDILIDLYRLEKFYKYLF